MPAPLDKSPAEASTTPIQFLKGVGPQRAELLHKLDLHTARDLIFFFPRDYQDLTELSYMAALRDEALVRLHGTVAELYQRQTSSGGTVLGALICCQGGNIRAFWFNQPFMARRLPVGQELLLSGKIRYRGGI